MIHYCFITGLYDRYDTLMFERQGLSLVEAGFKVTYVVCDQLGNEVKNGINIVSTGFSPKNRVHRFFKTKIILLDYVDKVDADIYQISDPELIGLVSCIRKKGKKVVFNLREYYPDMVLGKSYIPKILRPLISSYSKEVLKRKLKLYDAVFTVTDEFVDILRNDFRLTNVYLLTNYPRPDYNYQLSKSDYIKRPNLLFYEGTIYIISRQEVVFDAIKDIPDLGYLIAGVIEEGYEGITRHEYWPQVQFVNGFKKEQLKEFFSKATICNTLRDFGKLDGSLGVLKVFESMEAALPVLFSDVPLYRKIVDKYKCGLCVDPNNPVAIKDAICYLMNNKDVAYQMGQNARKAVLQEFNWHKQAKVYIKVINSIIK